MRQILTLIMLLAGVAIHSSAQKQQTAIRQSPDKIRTGQQIPIFTLPSRQGEQISFGGGVHSADGKHTLLVFCSTGCGYCYQAIGWLSREMDKIDNNVNIITVWGDVNRATFDAHQEHKKPIRWTDLWDEKHEAWDYSRIKIFPTFILLDPQDRVLKRMNGIKIERLAEWLRQLKDE